MAEAADSEDLTAAIEKHHAETQANVDRLKSIFAIIAEEPTGKKSNAIESIIAEGEEIMDEFEGEPALMQDWLARRKL